MASPTSCPGTSRDQLARRPTALLLDCTGEHHDCLDGRPDRQREDDDQPDEYERRDQAEQAKDQLNGADSGVSEIEATYPEPAEKQL